MSITAEQPTRSIRQHPFDSGELLILSGDSHKTGQDDDTERHYAALEQFLRRGSERLYVATGFNKRGMTSGTIAGVRCQADRRSRETARERCRPSRHAARTWAASCTGTPAETTWHCRCHGSQAARGDEAPMSGYSPSPDGVLGRCVRHGSPEPTMLSLVRTGLARTHRTRRATSARAARELNQACPRRSGAELHRGVGRQSRFSQGADQPVQSVRARLPLLGPRVAFWSRRPGISASAIDTSSWTTRTP